MSVHSVFGLRSSFLPASRPSVLRTTAIWVALMSLLLPCCVFGAGGITIPSGTWTLVPTHGLPAEGNGWEQLVYVPAIQQSIMLSQYHQRNSEPDESLVGYNFDTNSWAVIDMGGNFHTETMPEGGESQGFFGFDPNNNTIVYHCCTSGSNQSEDINHDWVYDVLGQSGRDRHTSPKPPAPVLLPGGAFDVADNVFIFHGGASFVGTWAYDPVGNIWKQMFPKGTVPDPSLALAGVAYSTATQQVYLFGGQSETAGTFSNNLYVYNYPTNTWTLITPSNGVMPPGRNAHGFAYDSTNNVFLVYGGANGSGILNDTWIYDPVANIWTQVTTPAPNHSNVPVYAKVSYDSDHNVFVLAQIGVGGDYFGGFWNTYGIETWLFRYAGGGPNAGTQVSTAAPAPGALNRYNTGWAKDPVLTSSGNSLYVGWSEAGSPFTEADDAWPHIYVSQYNGSNWIPLSTSFDGISSDIFEAHAPSLAIVNGLPWISYYQASNTGQTAAVYSSSWDGVSTWTGGAVGLVGSGSLFQGQSQIAAVGSVPEVALLQVDKTVYPQRTMGVVMKWTGSAWSELGTFLNHSTGAGDTALSISMSSDGVNPVATWSEYLHSQNNGNGYDNDTNPQIYVSQWNGAAWSPLGSSLNVNTANWAYDPSITYFNGAFYVAWVERTQAGNNQLYVKTWNGTSWALVGSGSLNRAPGAGWAFHPSLVSDPGSNSLYLGWVEQTALGQKAQVFVSKYGSGSWTNLGGAMNVDLVNGSAQRVSIGVYNGQPVAAWGEVNLGATRQIFVKQWNGSSWVLLPGTPVPDTTPPLAPATMHATAVSSTQINVSWNSPNNNSSTDTVGVTAYNIYRGGVQIATDTTVFSYLDTGLVANTSYCYTVAGVDGAGNVSPKSPSICATTNAQLAVSSVGLSPAQIVGGLSTTANTVTLNAIAPAGGAVVTLSSSDPGVTVPASVTVAAGATVSPTFTITTSPVAANVAIIIIATYGGTPVNATLTVLPPSPSAVTLSPASTLGGTSTTGNTVTLNGPAPAGGLVVTLSSNNPAATVPVSVTVAAGATVSPTFSISTSAVAVNTPVTISASHNGSTPATATLTLTTGSGSVTLTPASVVGGTGTSATVTLVSAAPSGGAVINLASNNGAASVPATVTVAGGEFVSPSFSIGTTAVSTTAFATISATYNGASVGSSILTVIPPSATLVSLAANAVIGGVSTTGSVTLNGPAPAGGAVLTMGSNNAAAGVPGTVTVAAGQTVSPSFSITTSAVAVNTPVMISASYNGGTAATAILTVTPGITAVNLTQTSVVGGISTTATVSFGAPAPAGGAVVTLGSSNGTASVPVSVTVAGGATVSPSFTITTTAVTSNTPVTISGTYGNVTVGAILTVTPPVGLGVQSVSISPSSVLGGSGITGMNTVTLTQAAPAGGVVVTLSSSDPSVTLPATVTVVSGQTQSPGFIITTAPVGTNLPVTISATANGITKAGSLTVLAPVVTQLVSSPNPVVGGASGSGYVTLSGKAPTGGAVVTLNSNTTGVTVPASVTVAAGQTVSPSFAVSTVPVTTSTPVTVSATYNGTVPATLTVNPVALSGISLYPTTVVGGVQVTGMNTVTLNGPAPSGGTVVALSSTDPSATVPATVTVPSGATNVGFLITTTAVATTTTVTISASYSGVTKTATLTVQGSLTVASAVNLVQGSVVGGTTTSATVKLSGPAPSGGAVVNLGSNNVAAGVPISVTVAAGATVSPSFNITTNPVSSSTPVAISATLRIDGQFHLDADSAACFRGDFDAECGRGR